MIIGLEGFVVLTVPYDLPSPSIPPAADPPTYLVRRCLCLHGGQRESGPGSPETSSHIFQDPTLACLPCSGGWSSVCLSPHLTSHQQVSNLVSLLELNISILFQKTKYRLQQKIQNL